MTIKTITYSESHELFSDFGLKKWKKLEVGATLNDGEDDQSAAKELKEKVQSMLAPELVPISEALQGVLPEKPIEKRIGLFVDDIMSCADLKTLETYKLLVKGKPELQEAYDKKRFSLLNAQL